MPYNYRQINYEVMINTVECCQTNQILIDAIKESISRQYIVYESDTVTLQSKSIAQTTYLVSGKRSYEAAKGYPGKKVAVLNFANNHTIGGAPFSAGAQEESLCRCSTLFPCLKAMEKPFYQKHQNDYKERRLTNMGNDDLIYTPDVVVFKSDYRTDPIKPILLPQEEWYKVNIITCAAPEMRNKPQTYPDGYRKIIYQRIKRILDVFAKEKNEVLILGAWGCGAFGNSLEVVANVFMELLPQYGFETVEFAMSKGDGQNSPFAKEIQELKSKHDEIHSTKHIAMPSPKDFIELIAPDMTNEEKQRFIAEMEQIQEDFNKQTDDEKRFREILTCTGREGVDSVLRNLKKDGFFTAPASVAHHSNWKGGLVNHSLKVYDQAIKLRKEILKDHPEKESELPEDSVTIAALLHDVCKHNQYKMGLDGKPCHKESNIPLGGHGFKSVVLLQYWGLKLWPIEILPIRWHMGSCDIKTEEERRDYQKALGFEIVKLIVKADHDASHEIG